LASTVFFASERVTRLEASRSLPEKFRRMLQRLIPRRLLKDKRIAVKMHLGSGLTYKTIHPLFVRILVEEVKSAGGKPFVTDAPADSAQNGLPRGYVQEVLGAPILPAAGIDDKHFYRHRVRHKNLKEIEVAGNIEDSDILINLAHAKGHGDCGFGGACKNLAMGCVTGRTRARLHSLEGGLKWDRRKCKFCGLCKKSCPHGALIFERGEKISFNYHLCSFCRHCVYICPEGAITIREADFDNFQEGMALAAREVLKKFGRGQAVHINFLMGMTMFCDCLGFSTPNLVPDIGILASRDIVALEAATLDSIRFEDLRREAVPPYRQLRQSGHLFERLHGKDPWIQVRALERLGLGSRKYKKVEIR